MDSLKSIIYPKQYIFYEDDGRKIYKTINEVENAKPVDEYLWSPITTISEKKVGEKVYSLIQHEDERLGWVNLSKSFQIFRHEPLYYKFVDQEFENHELNVKMGNEKDYRNQFNNKILTVKSEIEYDGETLLGVFIKNKFSGFHPEKYFEKMVECNVDIPAEILKNKKLYKLSSLNKVYDNKVAYDKPKLLTFYKQNNLGRVKVNNNEYFWITLDDLEDYIKNIDNTESPLTAEQKLYNDIVYGINLERQHSKEMLQTVLDARKYLNSKKAKEKDFRIKRLESSFKNAKKRNEEFQNTILKLEMDSLKSIIYPKQYIFYEDDGRKIYKTINEVENAKPVDEYLWSPITTISEKKVGEKVYSLIQHEDERLGWVNLSKSFQIFRHEPLYYKFVDQEFENHELNVKMGNEKDYRNQFNNKILTVKSEIEYDGETLLGVFIKNKFSGFHPEKYFEKMVECNVDIPAEILKNKKLYKLSSLNKVYDNKVAYDKPKLLTFYKQNNLGRVKVNNNEYFWITLDDLEDYIKNIDNTESPLTAEQKLYNDIVYGINLERQHSKEMLQTVLDARKYLNSKKAKEKDFRIKRLESSFKNAKKRNEEFQNTILKLETELKMLKKDKPVTEQRDIKIKEENKELKNEILELKRSINKLENSNKLSEKRLEHQKDYNERLELQKDKYKNRMNLVEERMKKFLQKNDSED